MVKRIKGLQGKRATLIAGNLKHWEIQIDWIFLENSVDFLDIQIPRVTDFEIPSFQDSSISRLLDSKISKLLYF